MNTTNYVTALESFILKSQQLTDAEPKQVSKAMAELCSVLRVGKVEVALYENEGAVSIDDFESIYFYNSSNADLKRRISRRITGIDEKVAFYNVYALEGEAEWTEQEENSINTFITFFSTFNEKNRLTKLAHYMTYYDGDFGMYNLNQFMKNVRILHHAEKLELYTAVRFNLKHFSVVNQYIGRRNGTIVMKKFISRIDDLLYDEYEAVCRIGGDNFITIFKNNKLSSVLEILNGTGIIYDEFRNERVFITATAGVFTVKDCNNITLPSDVMDRVSLAFHLAKNSPKTDIVFFDDALLERNKHSNNISANFPRALENREFVVYYQPKVTVDGRRIAGAEALCRWIHNGHLISPGEFIPVLEQGRDICKLDFYVLDTVCRDIRRWLDSGKNVVRISVNLSRRHLSDADLLEHILEIIDKNNVPHEYIEIELTETTTDVEFKDLKRTIKGLQQSGISTSVDDFGIGYSSLNLIKEIPWNVLKLDKSLLPAEGDENPAQKNVMFKYIIAMAQEMGLECISEGVETKEQVQLLAENKCMLAQGFYFDKPLSVEEFETRLNNYIYDR